ncbi:MAG: hypothetical protein AAF570_25085, partial [Bacteroidota bacterium]
MLIFLANSSFSQQLFFSNSTAPLDEDQQEVLDRVYGSGLYDSYQLIDVSTLANSLQNRALRIDLGEGCGIQTLQATTIEFVSESNYFIYAEFEDLVSCEPCDRGWLMFEVKDGEKFGTLKLSGNVYQIEDLGGRNVLLQQQPAESNPPEGGRIGPKSIETTASEMPDLSGLSGMKTQMGNCDVRVLFLFTEAASNQLADVAHQARRYIAIANIALANSGINASQLRFVLAEALTHNGVNETNQTIENSLSGVRNDFSAQTLRNTHDADIVCLVTDHTIANYGLATDGAYSGTNGAPAANNNAYSMMRLANSIDQYYFPNVAGRNLGCGYEVGPNTSTNVNYPYQFIYTTGWFLCQETHQARTLMWSYYAEDMILHYSNPNVDYKGEATGTALDNNASI